MAPSFNYLSGILHSPTSTTNYFFGFKKPPPGEFQYCGPHFLAAIRFAVKLDSKKNDGFTILEESAYESFHRSVSEDQKFLNLIASSLTQIRELFVVQTLYKYLSGINPNRVDIIASFIEFLVDIIERLSYRSFYWIIIPGGINIVCQRLKFLFFVIWDMPLQCTKQEGRKNILAEIECAVNKVGMFLYSFVFTANHISITKMDLELSALLSKIDPVEEIIKNHLEMFGEQPEFTSSDLTSTSIYIVDSLLGDLNHLLDCKADLVPQVKDQIATLQEELYSCRSMVRDKELQQNKELEECEMQLIDLAYQAEHLIACFVAGEVPIWYLALKLPSFILRSKHIQDSLFNLKLNLGISDLQVSQSSTKVSSTQEATQSISMTHDITVGFKQTRRQMESELIGGPDRLQIIAIIGMGGLGKTTLARELYNESNVLLRFDRRSWCVVSQTYQKRKLLTDILNSISVLKKDEIYILKDDELADRVYKSLKRIRYLLVVDDIWNIEVWDDLKRYFPDDRNGSRILFTTRNKDVALEASSEASIHDLPLLLEDECWDLLQKKVFPNSICPLELQDVGKEIVRNCKGLPIAVVGIAAILASMDNKKNLWQEVSTNLTSYISKDRDILELSY